MMNKRSKSVLAFMTALLMAAVCFPVRRVHAVQYITNVPITYDAGILVISTKATGSEVTQGLIAALHPNENDQTFCGESAYIDSRTSFTYLAKKTEYGYNSLSDSTVLLDMSEEYYLSFNIEDAAGWNFDTDHLPSVTINGKPADSVVWNSQEPTGHIQAYQKVYPVNQDFCYSVTLSETSQKVQKGTSFQFSADVLGSVKSVKWQLGGSYTSSSTKVSTAGKVTVGADETASEFTVRASSTLNPSVYAEATVIVLAEPVAIDSVTIEPKEITMPRGTETTFTVTVAGSEDHTVKWEVLDSYDSGTYINNGDDKGYLKAGVMEPADTIRVRVSSVKVPSKYDEAVVHLTEAPFVRNVPIIYDASLTLFSSMTGAEATEALINALHPNENEQAFCGETAYIDARSTFTYLAKKTESGYASLSDSTDPLSLAGEYYLSFNVEEAKGYYFDINSLPAVTVNGKAPDKVVWNSKDPTGHIQVYSRIYLSGQEDIQASYEVGLMDFGKKKEGYSAFEYKYLEITNTGNVALHFNTYKLSGDTGAFEVISAMPATVNPSQTRQGVGIRPKSGLKLKNPSDESSTYVMTLQLQDTDGYTAAMDINVMFTVTSAAYSTVTFDTKGKGSPVPPLTVKNGARFSIGEAGDPDFAYYDEKRVIPGYEEDFVFDWWYWDEEATNSRVHYMDTIDEDVTLYAGWLPAIKTINVAGTGSIYDGYTTAKYESEQSPNIGPLAAEEDLYDWIQGDGWYTKSGGSFNEFNGTFKAGKVYYLRITARSSEDYRFACNRVTDEFLVSHYNVDWRPVTPEGIDGKARVVSFYVPFYVPSVQISQTSLDLNKGETKQLSASVIPADTPHHIVWYSADPSIASVDGNGKVKGLKKGTAYIWAAAHDEMDNLLAQASCKVTVKVPVASVKLNKTSLTLIKGNAETLIATIQPTDASNKVVTWTSSDPSVASVASNGKVTAVSYGPAVITVTTQDGGQKAQCTVSVTSSDPVEAFVIRLYQLCLNRKPDAGGFADWTNKLKSGTATAAQVVQGFFNSKEMTNLKLSDSEYIERCYLVMMDRASDAGGKKNWLETKAAGVSNNYILRGFVHSNEFTGLCNDFGITRGSIILTEPRDQNLGITKFVSRCYSEVLGRKADTGGLNGWCEKILNAPDRKQEAINTASNGFFHSPEFIGKNTTDEQYVTILYKTFLGREPDAGGFANWVNKLKNGVSRDTVLMGFANSAEFAKIMADYGIH